MFTFFVIDKKYFKNKFCLLLGAQILEINLTSTPRLFEK
jgi:hypothetical protein